MPTETLRRHSTFSFSIKIGYGFFWIAYTLVLVSYQINKGLFTLTIARVFGVVLSGFCLLFFASVMFFPSA
jgi:succinate-acetate transporter protein